MSLFTYTYADGRSVNSDILPINDIGIVELIFLRIGERFLRDKIRPHLSHPEHENAMLNLPPSLRILRAENCKIRNWPMLPLSIEECYLNGNNYLRLPNLSLFTHLIVLELNDNSIEGISNPLPPNLARLNLDCNALRTFNISLIPVSCASLSTFSNPYEVKGFGRPVRNVLVEDDPAEKPANVYVNNHNVHDSGVQKSTKANIQYLINYRKEIPENPNLWKSINNEYTNTGIKNIEDLPGSILQTYSVNPYIMHSVSFTYLIDRIWLRIQDLTNKDIQKELLKRFKEETEDGKTHCTNGMMVRMTNVFLGFDENIVVKLNINQILSARIPATQERIRKLMDGDAGPVGSEIPAFWVAVYKETIKDLEELEVNLETYGAWLQPLAEPVLENLFETKGLSSLLKSKRPTDEIINELIKSTGLKGYPFETQYLISLWS